jgi:hypothetical protein
VVALAREQSTPAGVPGPGGVAVRLGLGTLDVEGPHDVSDGPGHLHDRPQRGEPAGDRRGLEPTVDQAGLVAERRGVGFAVGEVQQSGDGGPGVGRAEEPGEVLEVAVIGAERPGVPSGQEGGEHVRRSEAR